MFKFFIFIFGCIIQNKNGMFYRDPTTAAKYKIILPWCNYVQVSQIFKNNLFIDSTN